MSKLAIRPVSGLSILMGVLALTWGSGISFFTEGLGRDGPLGFFTPSRLGFNLAWLTLVYLSFQLLSIPPCDGHKTTVHRRGGWDGVIDPARDRPRCDIREAGRTFGHAGAGWEAAFLLLFIAAIDLFGGYTFRILLSSRRTMDVAAPMTS